MSAAVQKFLFLIFLIFASSCSFVGLQKDIDQLDTLSVVSGSVTKHSGSTDPILVALYRQKADDEYELGSYSVLYGAGDFELTSDPGKFYLIAFEDKNQDFSLQRDEFIGWYGGPTLLTIKPGENYPGRNLLLRSPDQAEVELPELYAPGAPQILLSIENVRLGDVVEQSDPIFASENGQMGMWNPVKFFEQGKTGIFFLEAYDPTKVPVLFVHGLTGTGQDWEQVIYSMDRTRFQPWIMQYPSALRLDLLGKTLNNAVKELQIRHKFKDLIVVAHSMGGLIARKFINENASQNNKEVVKLFVSIATPWKGHEGAQIGISHAPAVVPSWYDLAPNSPFLNSLLDQPLPDHVSYYLFFAHQNTNGFLSPDNSDGTVTIRSQLSDDAQAQANRIIGIDENHSSILRSKTMTDKLVNIFNSTINR